MTFWYFRMQEVFHSYDYNWKAIMVCVKEKNRVIVISINNWIYSIIRNMK